MDCSCTELLGLLLEGILADDDDEADDQLVGSSGDQADPPSVSSVNSYVCYDGSGHLPRKVAKLPKYCKMEGCKRRSKMHCVKYMVYLCIDEKSDCFYRFRCKF